MDKTKLMQRTRGIAVFTVTPFTETGQVDVAGVARNTEFLVNAGIPMAVVCGGVGEIFSLSNDERRLVAETAAEAANGRMVIFTGVTGDGPASVAQAQAAEAAGADGVLLFPDDDVVPDTPSLLEYFKQVSEAVDIGLMPSRPNARVDIDALMKLADLPNVVALKEELLKMDDFREIVLAVGDRMTVIGALDSYAPCYLLFGAGGLACGLSSFLPALYLEMWDAAQRCDYVEVMSIHSRLEIFNPLLQKHGIAMFKAAMELIGLSGGPCRSGPAQLDATDRAALAAALRTFDLDVVE